MRCSWACGSDGSPVRVARVYALHTALCNLGYGSAQCAAYGLLASTALHLQCVRGGRGMRMHWRGRAASAVTVVKMGLETGKDRNPSCQPVDFHGL